MPSKDKYSDPKLRDQVKEQLKQGDKGGEPGQWSARKAQMMAKEYKKRGGDYNTPKDSKDESQENLKKWGDEEWQTKDGSGQAKKEDGSRKRYLPKKAWEEMSEKEKEQTDKRKQEEGKNRQFVLNTAKAKEARKSAGKKVGEEFTKKRGRKAKDDGDKDQNKKPKIDSNKSDENNSTIGSKHDKADAPAQQGSKDRLPKKGQKNVHWKAMPGWVEGEVVEIARTTKSVDGKQVKASKDDPKVVLKSKSGKICVHKPDNVYFD
ncbi:hypothetical protein M406DRAFT_331675 [Cryphonectria parasitica EP155]|uniref:Hypervirulence associated protein TUDOR domain-containing protein n=1 Tax=Cryphonectria parasitica (strain ATCC 38755 / EP155) TaxID=660469 RepID=A0A9P4XYZ0_CRYP1|nr:uncharacterized protein M406DRAFT_331675 [Cryphonectria parasitica EP155]KAF3763110.1 hypothetical protein M406DRAFT_331675 [Cryphonectria parasitica EP155]